MLSYLEDAKSIAACHSVLALPLDEEKNAKAISYNDNLIEAFTPELKDGRWLQSSKNTEKLEVVISENDYGWTVGDSIPLLCTGYPDGFVTEAEIVGIIEDDVKIPYASARDGEDKYTLFYDSYSFAIEEIPIMLFSSDTIRNLNTQETGNSILQGMMYSALITYPDDYTEEQLSSEKQKLSSMGCLFSESLRKMDKNSKQYLYEQVYNLLPIVAVLLVLTAVSSVSSSALSTKRRLRDYAIYYVCGLKWRQCILINMIQSLILSALSVILAFICTALIKYTYFSQYIKIIWKWETVLVLAGAAALYILVSMIMPVILIGRNTPKQILTK